MLTCLLARELLKRPSLAYVHGSNARMPPAARPLHCWQPCDTASADIQDCAATIVCGEPTGAGGHWLLNMMLEHGPVIKVQAVLPSSF